MEASDKHGMVDAVVPGDAIRAHSLWKRTHSQCVKRLAQLRFDNNTSKADVATLPTGQSQWDRRFEITQVCEQPLVSMSTPKGLVTRIRRCSSNQATDAQQSCWYSLQMLPDRLDPAVRIKCLAGT